MINHNIKDEDNNINFYQSITDIVQAGINLVDKNGIIIYVNDAYCKMHDYTKEELIGKSLDMILPSQNPIDGLERYKKIINQQVILPNTVESTNIRKDGSSFPVLISWNYLMNNDQLEGMVTVIQDLTQIKNVEDALKDSEKKYRSLVENISDFIWEIDQSGNYTYVSPKSKELFAFKPKDMIGKKIWDFIIETDIESIKKLKDVLITKEPFSHKELLKKQKSGNIIAVESSGIPVFNDNQFMGFRGIDRDITLKKKVEEVDLEIKTLKDKLEKREYLEYIMGDSSKIREVHKAVEKVAKTDFSVIINGETGAGKEIIANSIHNFSNRKTKSLISIDCGAIPETLIESELFGCIKGAFTGAIETKDGAFQMANGGTIFLDEITNLSLEMQKKLLRVLQEKEVRKVGATQTEKLDIRIIAASNENIMELVNGGNFRKDLFFRLNEFNITIPPLRDRKEDILMLAQRFIKEICPKLNIKTKRISKQAIKALLNYQWPGNVRELKNTIKKAIIISEDEIRPEHLDLIEKTEALIEDSYKNEYLEIFSNDNFDFKKMTHEQLVKIEKEIIKKGLQKFDGNKSKLTKFFNIDYKTLLKKIDEYGLYQ